MKHLTFAIEDKLAEKKVKTGKTWTQILEIGVNCALKPTKIEPPQTEHNNK